MTAQRILEALLDGADPACFLEIWAIGGELQFPRQWFIPVKTIRRVGLPVEVLALDGIANVYYSLIPRVRRGGTAADCAAALAVWADLDQELPASFPLLPSVLIESSPGKYQALWLLDCPCAGLARIESLNRAIAAATGADRALEACAEQLMTLREQFQRYVDNAIGESPSIRTVGFPLVMFPSKHVYGWIRS